MTTPIYSDSEMIALKKWRHLVELLQLPHNDKVIWWDTDRQVVVVRKAERREVEVWLSEYRLNTLTMRVEIRSFWHGRDDCNVPDCHRRHGDNFPKRQKEIPGSHPDWWEQTFPNVLEDLDILTKHYLVMIPRTVPELVS